MLRGFIGFGEKQLNAERNTSCNLHINILLEDTFLDFDHSNDLQKST